MDRGGDVLIDHRQWRRDLLQGGGWEGFVLGLGDVDSNPRVFIKKCFSCTERINLVSRERKGMLKCKLETRIIHETCAKLLFHVLLL